MYVQEATSLPYNNINKYKWQYPFPITIYASTVLYISTSGNFSSLEQYSICKYTSTSGNFSSLEQYMQVH